MKVYSIKEKFSPRPGQKFLVLALCLVILAVFPAGVIYGRQASIKEILENPRAFDGRRVEVEGEVIGEPLKSANGAWVNISSGGYNLGVFFSGDKDIRRIRHWGSYTTYGDYIKVKGLFFADCPEHNEADFHASELDILRYGRARRKIIPAYKITLLIFSLTICLVLAAVYFIKIYFIEKHGKRA